MQKIVLATNNKGKVKEMHDLLVTEDLEVIAQSEFNVPDIDETGLTFVENALLKARHTAKITGLPVIADDSGLVVEALNGAPGIYSARYATEHGEANDDKKNIQKLLTELKSVPSDKRRAYFYCALVYMRHENDPTPIICLGKWQGRILHKEQGNSGFGYDPVFYLDNLNCTAAELSREQKSQLSHRGQALKQLIQTLSRQ
ncbi:XTP/dITP diphosphatase [Orbaceae bacterium ac157xtp]